MRLAINLILGAALIFSLFDTTQVQIKKHNLQSDIRLYSSEINARQAEVMKAREQLQALTTRQETIRILEEEADAPVVEAIYRSLDELIPENLTLDRCAISLDKIGANGRAEYLFQIEGVAPEGKALIPMMEKMSAIFQKSGWKMEVEAKTGDTPVPGADPQKQEGPRKPGGYFIRARVR
jgi:hypothetical protein